MNAYRLGDSRKGSWLRQLHRDQCLNEVQRRVRHPAKKELCFRGTTDNCRATGTSDQQDKIALNTVRQIDGQLFRLDLLLHSDVSILHARAIDYMYFAGTPTIETLSMASGDFGGHCADIADFGI